MSEDFPLKKQFTDEVIDHTIMFEDICGLLFLEHFGIKPEPDNHKREMQIERFNRYFMNQIGWYSKLNLLREVLEDLFPEIKFPSSFNEKFREFYEIRNLFAHSMFPREVGQKTPYVSRTGNWKELYEMHTELYGELSSFVGICTARFAPSKD